MVSNEAISALFSYLGGQGYRRPDAWKPDVPGNPTKAEIFASWRHTFRHCSDRDLMTAGTVYVANGGKFWPNGGQLIALIPPSGPPLLGWAAIWARARKRMPHGGSKRPPGLTAEESERRGFRAWRLAPRDDEHDAAMVALDAAGGWYSIATSEDPARLKWAKRDFEITFNATLKTTTASTQWLLGGGVAPLQLEDSEGRTV